MRPNSFRSIERWLTCAGHGPRYSKEDIESGHAFRIQAAGAAGLAPKAGCVAAGKPGGMKDESWGGEAEDGQQSTRRLGAAEALDENLGIFRT